MNELTGEHVIEVGLTGGIGCGKSTVSAMLAGLGALIIDADTLARQALEPGTRVYNETVAAFGRRILTSDGTVDRAALARIVFSDAEKRALLESIVHPAVFELEASIVERLRRERPDAVAVFDAALLIESGAYARMDKVVLVWCRPETQFERLVSLNGLEPEQARLRISAQMPIDDKRAYADYIVDNDGSVDDTLRQVEELFRQLKQYV